MNNQSRLLFLLGSGISIPAGFPATVELTQRILSGEGVILASDEIFYLDNDSSGDPLSKKNIPRIKSFLEVMKKEIDAYKKKFNPGNSQDANYEELYYLIKQIHDDELQEYDNPALNALIDKISSEITPSLIPDENGMIREWTLAELAFHSCNFIFDIVWHSLVITPKRLDHLHSVLEACLDKTISHVDICTLNHDTLLEQYLVPNLAKHQIQLNDGFSPLENGSRYWDSSLLEDERIKVRLLKLHGSINWFEIQNSIGGEKVVIPPQGWEIDNVRDNEGHIQRPTGRTRSRTPLFLVGTFNKMLDYTQSIFADLYCQFHKSLWKTNSLVVCGYSFHDKGINTQIAEWLFSDRQHKLLVIREKPDELLRSARGAISNNWEKYWLRNGQLLTVPKMIEDVTWGEILSCLKGE